MPRGRKKTLGAWGENLAVGFLERNGFEIVERNFYATVGEIDIVAQKSGDYYFVEVKTRTEEALSNDAAITERKIFRLNKAVKIYCYKRGVADVGIVMAGLIVGVKRKEKKVRLRFFIVR